MATHKRLVTQHLELVSWRLLEEYQQIIRDLSRKRAGIYALYKGSELYYVGLANTLMNRVKAHIKDRHKGAWDRFSVYLTVQDDHIRELEALLLRIVVPGGNRVGGRFVKSTNLLPQLNRLITESDKDHKAELLGGWVAERRRRTKARRARGKGALRGLVIRRLTLKAERNGWAYGPPCGETERSATTAKSMTRRMPLRVLRSANPQVVGTSGTTRARTATGSRWRHLRSNRAAGNQISGAPSHWHFLAPRLRVRQRH